MSEYHLVTTRDLKKQRRRAFWGGFAAVAATVIQALVLTGAVPSDFRIDKICQAIVMVLSAYGYQSALRTPVPIASVDTDKLPRRKQP